MQNNGPHPIVHVPVVKLDHMQLLLLSSSLEMSEHNVSTWKDEIKEIKQLASFTKVRK